MCAPKQETYCTAINADFGQQERILVKKSKRGVQRPVKVLEEQRFTVDGIYRQVVSAFHMSQRLFLWPYLFEGFGLQLPLCKHRSSDRSLDRGFGWCLARDVRQWRKSASQVSCLFSISASRGDGYFLNMMVIHLGCWSSRSTILSNMPPHGDYLARASPNILHYFDTFHNLY